MAAPAESCRELQVSVTVPRHRRWASSFVVVLLCLILDFGRTIKISRYAFRPVDKEEGPGADRQDRHSTGSLDHGTSGPSEIH